MSEQLTLELELPAVPAAEVIALRPCRSCGARRPLECEYERDRSELNRPRSCVNRHDPTTAPIPF